MKNFETVPVPGEIKPIKEKDSDPEHVFGELRVMLKKNQVAVEECTQGVFELRKSIQDRFDLLSKAKDIGLSVAAKQDMIDGLQKDIDLVGAIEMRIEELKANIEIESELLELHPRDIHDLRAVIFSGASNNQNKKPPTS